MALLSVEHCSRMVYCISLGTLRKKLLYRYSEGVRRLNDPFDLFGSLSGLTLLRVLFTDGILHLIRDTSKKTAFQIVAGRRFNDPYGSLSALRSL